MSVTSGVMFDVGALEMTDTPGAQAARAKPSLIAGPILPTLTRLAVPNTVANLFMILPLIVEAWRLAELGVSALAGVALVFPLLMLLTMWSAGSIGGAISGAVARALGAGDMARAEAIARAALVIGIGGAIVLGALVFGGARTLFTALGGGGAVLDAALGYARVLFGFSMVIWLFNVMSGVLRGAGDMVRPLIAIAVIAGVHLLASGPVILGFGDSQGFGVPGAAGVLIGAYTVGLIVLLVILRRPSSAVRLRWGGVDRALIGQLLRPGLFAATQSLMTIATSMILAGFAARFGENVLAGYGLGARIELLMIPLIFGVGGASIAMGGAATGAGMHGRAVRVGWTTAGIAAALIGGIGILLALSVGTWATGFSANAAIGSVLVSYMERVGPVYAAFAVGLALFFTSQGIGTLLYPVLGAAVRLLVVLVGGAVVFAQDAPRVEALFVVIAVAMLSYGLFNAVALWLGPWRGRQDDVAGS